MSKIVNITDESFLKEVAQSELPVIAKFEGEWCGPCKKISPMVEMLATEMFGKFKVVKVDVDDCPELSSNFKIKSVPTFILFKGGIEQDRKIGSLTKEELLKLFR